jgi:hypothetical protein
MPQSPYLLYEHIVQGQFQAEVVANQFADILERKMVNKSDISIAGTGTVVLDNDQVRDFHVNFTGTLTGNRVVEVPARNMPFLLENSTTGAFTVTFQVEGGAGNSLEIGRGYKVWVWSNGTNVFDLQREQTEYVSDQNATYTATDYDRIINGDTGGGAFTITLPQVVPGKQILVTSVGAATTLTIARGGADTIKGVSTSITIGTQWQAVLFVGESATNWLAFRLTVA